MNINYNPSRHVAGAVVAAVAAAGLLYEVAPGEDRPDEDATKNRVAAVAEAVVDVLPPAMTRMSRTTAVADGNGVKGSAAGAVGAAVGPRLGPVDAQGSPRLGPCGRLLQAKKKHTRRNPGEGALMITKAPPIYLRCTRHGEKQRTRRDFAFLSSVYFFMLAALCMWLLRGFAFLSADTHAGLTDDRPAHLLTD